jgi:hypothetical protein
VATYKVLQDIEAEDTLVGPLTLRQCIYAAVAAFAAYLSVMSVLKHAAFLVIFWFPFIAVGVFFAFPWNRQQPTEVWALAKVRFMFKPRKRIWNQSGIKELVTVTAPRAVKATYQRNLSRNEVQNRLRALADTIDSRGWAVKNIDLSTYMQPAGADSDRLVGATMLPQQVLPHDDDDIFDVRSNPVAQKFDMMMNQSAQEHRQQLMSQLAQPTMQQTMPTTVAAPARPAPAPMEPGLQQTANPWHMRTILPAPISPVGPLPQPLGMPAAPQTASIPAASTPSPAPSMPATPAVAATSDGGIQLNAQAPAGAPAAMTDEPRPAILELANNNDLNVATLAREAQARSGEPPEEVSVSFH